MVGMFLFAAQQAQGKFIRTKLPIPVDSFFHDSGMGFDGQYNRCVWVCCVKRLKPGDTLRIIKLCGGMIGGCSESWTLHHWNSTEWYLDRSRRYRQRRKRNVRVEFKPECTTIRYGKKKGYKLIPMHQEGVQFGHYLLQMETRK